MRVLIIVAASMLCLNCAAVPDWTIPQPRPSQLAWQQAEFGVLICYELGREYGFTDIDGRQPPDLGVQMGLVPMPDSE